MRIEAVSGTDSPAVQASTSKRVLIVEDDEAVAKLYQRALRGEPYTLYRARNGSEAVSLVESTSFDAIVSDLTMPGMGGIELLKSVRRHDLEVPIVIVTGRPAVESAITAVECGALRYLLKPVRIDEFKAAVARAVEAKAAAATSRRALRMVKEKGLETRPGSWSEAELREALASLYMVYQPIVNAAGRNLFGYEALVRTRHPLLSCPRDLLAAAEELAALKELGRRIRFAVASTMDDLPGNPLVFVNHHATELLDDELYSDRNPLQSRAGRIVVELTEQARVEGLEERIRAIRSMGFRLAIDDLGEGYAALTHLVRFEPDFAKIDLDLVRGIDRSPSKRMLVQSLVGVCRRLGIRLVCEGVETQLEGACLLELGAELLQGYYFARPKDAFDERDRNLLAERLEALAPERNGTQPIRTNGGTDAR